jgi:hypothetical protein
MASPWRAVLALGAWSLFLVLVFEQRLGAQVADMRQENTELKARLREVLPRPAEPEVPDFLSPVPPAGPSDTLDIVPKPDDRRLGNIFTLGTTAGAGCYEFTGGTDTTLDLSSATCSGSAKCPACFFSSSLDNDVTLTISACSTAINYIPSSGSSVSYTGVREYVFINGDDTDTLTVTDGTNSFKIGPMTMVNAACYSSGNNKLYFSSNYGVAGSNVATCPDGCDSATPKYSSDSATSFTLIPGLDSDKTTRVGYLTDSGPSGAVTWGGVFAGFSTDVNDRIGYLTNSGPSAAVTWGGVFAGFSNDVNTKLGYLTTNGPSGAVTYGGTTMGFADAVHGFFTNAVPTANLAYGSAECSAGEYVCQSR